MGNILAITQSLVIPRPPEINYIRIHGHDLIMYSVEVMISAHKYCFLVLVPKV